MAPFAAPPPEVEIVLPQRSVKRAEAIEEVSPRQLVDATPLSLRQVVAHVNLICNIMKEVMVEGEHYGTIPGTNKPALFKSGAEKLILTFKLVPMIKVERENLPNLHREYTVTVQIHSVDGILLGEGVGSCSTMEKKYRWRVPEITCPKCGKTAIIKGKEEYGGGWVCFAKKGGCGAKYKDNELKAPEGRVENPDIADVYNTCLKMAKKRALVDATLTVTGASDIFTQDVEDTAEEAKK